MEALVDSLLADGHLGVFAAFLVFQFIAMQKRLDKLVAGFQEQLETMRKEYTERSEKMRERYDRVIQEYRNREDDQSKDFLITRTKVHNDIVSKLDRILDRDK
jgi:hydrogenase maturation factor|tara:strand:- start:270 stop:578 length:309 start_codon:yes stop_codon:yes gene_type:complete